MSSDRPHLRAMTAPAADTPPGARRASSAASWGIALAVGLSVAAIYSVFAWRQWESLFAPSWDLGIFSQLAQDYSRFQAPIVPIKGHGFNLLGDHFHPLLVLTGPLWALWPSGLTLLVLQGVLFGLSAVPLTRLAVERWGAPFGAAFGLAYGFVWGLQSALVSQFHEIAFAVPILAFTLAAYLRGRLTAAALWAGALVFVKEDLGLTVAVFGLVMAFRPLHRGDAAARRTGLALAAWGVAWLVLATAVILPALNPLDQYDYTGRIGNPLEFFLPPVKWLTVGMLAAAAGVIGLRSPLVLLMLPTLTWRFVGNVEHYWGWMWHYSAVLMPIAVAALLESLDTWRPRVPGRPHAGPALRWGALAAVVAPTIATALWAASVYPVTYQQPMTALLDGEFNRPSPRWDAAREVVASIPEGATVSADISLMSYLVPHAEVYWFGNVGDPPPEYVLMDLEGYHYQNTRQPGLEALAEEAFGVDYSPHAEVGGYAVVVRTGAEPAPSPTMEP